MISKILSTFIVLSFIVYPISKSKEIAGKTLQVIPISHATMVLKTDKFSMIVDPTGGLDALKDYNNPEFVLITDIHGDHMSIKTLEALDLSNTTLIVPQAVYDKLPSTLGKEKIIINNGEEKSFKNFKVEAIPMYNLREEALKFHTKGRGNGYVLTINKKRIYISGDTEDIPEMRALKNIDMAFVCMNLPYTMPVESAANAVIEFAPKQVYPYHYRGTGGLSDVAKFKELVKTANKKIEVVQLEWYK